MAVNFCQSSAGTPPPGVGFASSVGSCSRQSRKCDPTVSRQVTPAFGGQDLPEHLQQTLRNKWPEAIRPLAEQNSRFFSTGLAELDRLFPSGRGIPCGQLIEITGGPSSGKTSLLFRLLGAAFNPTLKGRPLEQGSVGSCSRQSRECDPTVSRQVTPALRQAQGDGYGAPPLGVGGATCRQASRPDSEPLPRVAYIDLDNTFFPDDTTGLDLSRLLVIRPNSTGTPPLAVGSVENESSDLVRGGQPAPDLIRGPRPPRINPTLKGGPPGSHKQVASVPATRPGGSCELTPVSSTNSPRQVTPPPAFGGAGAGPDATYSPLTSGLRAAELLLRDHHASIVVIDLVGCHTPLSIGLLHRLRLKTVRARGLMIFLTERTALIPSSMASLRLEVQRGDLIDQYRITVTKSRLCAEGIRLEVTL